MEKIALIPPSEILLAEFMEPSGISQAKLAGDLGIPQSIIAGILEWKESIGTEMAARLSAYFTNSADFWTNLQNNYNRERVERFGVK